MRQAVAASGKLPLRRAHRLIHKVPQTHRYHLAQARQVDAAALTRVGNANPQKFAKLAT
jgi:hypothetical protein